MKWICHMYTCVPFLLILPPLKPHLGHYRAPSWNSSTLATWCEELTHLKRSWCWERLKAEGEGDDRVWDGWMALPTQWTWVWVSSGSWWWTRRPGVLQSMGLQRVGHDWETELNWILLNFKIFMSLKTSSFHKMQKWLHVYECLHHDNTAQNS